VNKYEPLFHKLEASNSPWLGILWSQDLTWLPVWNSKIWIVLI
jgi:hypothetical protein